MALNIGELFGSLSWRHDKQGADEFDRRYDEAAAKAKKKIEAELGAAVDDRAFAKYHESLNRAEKRAREKEAFKAALGADFDPKGFNAYQRALGQAERDAKRAAAPGGGFSDLNRAMGDFNRQATFARNVVGQIKWPALITGAGLAAQAASTAAAGVTALGSALAPLSGALAAYPALGSAAAQGLGVFKLGTAGLADGFKAAAEGGKAWEDELKKLTPQQAAFIRELKPVVDNVKSLKAEARENMLPGLERGALAAAKNVGVLRPIVDDTAKAIGRLADQAGHLVGQRGFGRDLALQGERNVKWIGEAGEGAIALTDALRNVTIAAGPLVDWMVRGAVSAAKQVDLWTRLARESGKLAGFFHQTQVEMSRVVRIGADLAVAFFNIARAGKPLGDDILVSLVKSAQAFRDWTDSARGQNAIARYFREARPGIFEAGRLIRDIVKDFFQLGRGDQIAPLLRQIRTQLLPALVRVVDSTTRAFGPALINALTQVLLLLGHMAGSSGPLVQIVTLIGKFAEGMNRLLDRFPQLNSALVNIAAIGGLAKAFQIAGAITGVTRLIGLLKTARTAAAGATAVEAAGGAAGAAGAVGRGPAARNVGSAALGAAGGVPGLAVAGGAVVLLNVIKDSDKNARRFASALDVVTRSARQLASRDNLSGLRTLSQSLTDMGKKSGLSGSQIRTLQGVVADFANKTKGHLHDIAVAWGRTLPQVQRDTDSTFRQMARNTAGHLSDIRKSVTTNTGIIKQRLGTDTNEGRQALAHNFRLAARAVQTAMDQGKVSTQTGTREIRRLMIAALKQLGFTESQADLKLRSGLRGGSVQQAESSRQPGQGLAPPGGAQGGFGWQVATGARSANKKAGGGFFGERGQRGQDTIHALVGEGEAILNHHQQEVVEGLLGPGFLDWLFASVRRPHFAAMGGKIKRFAAGGIAGAVAAAGQLERAHFPYRWGGGHQATPAPFGPMDCSGAVSYVLQRAGINIPTMTSGQLASAGKPGTGAITVFANPVHTFMRIGDRYFGTSGTNPGGGAGWMPDPGAGYRARFAQRAFAGGGGELGIGIPRIRGPRTLMTGGMGALVQRGFDATTSAANDKIAAAWAAMGLGTGDVGDPGPSGAGTGNPATIRAALRLAGQPASAGNVRAIQILMGKESGGVDQTNPTAVGGEHATGLMQMLPSTFRHYAVRGHGNIHNALDNIAASVRYQMARYGHLVTQSPYARGGIVQRFARGGRAGARRLASAAGRAVGQAAGTNLKIKSLRAMQVDRIADFDNYMGAVEDDRNLYGRIDARYNLTEEELIDPDTGAIDVAAIQHRLNELFSLANVRTRIESNLKQARIIARRVVKTYRTIIDRLTKSLRHTKGKNRSGIRSQIKTYRERLTADDGWLAKLKDLDADVYEAHTDVLEIGKEIAEVRGTRAEPQDTSTDDTTGAGDTGTGLDTGSDTGTDTAAAPPSALDIAAGVQAALAEYKSQQSDLIRNFGANAVGARSAFAPGGVLSATPDLEGAALGALRGFGGGSNLAGSLGAGAGGPSVGQLVVNFQNPPQDGPTLMSQLRFQVENGGAG